MTDTSKGSDREIDRLFEALARRRRRRVVRVLDSADGPVAFSDLVGKVAGADDADRPAVDAAATRERVRTSLRRVHLPVLAEAGVAERGPEGTVVRPGTAFDAALALLTVGPEPADRNRASDGAANAP
ncbi:hypothetical protein G9464_08280 [Halostella sp. JP-L12]|uniref:DUF7344 domain-containing protein n=1 Tax=Halostella TaxID=1843185 RepID=UPI000EF7DFA3|nr:MULTISPECIES: hypothetical protein [Halostella]NHN47591.1 hypothetical protein [Halostella sp. JP-L12]